MEHIILPLTAFGLLTVPLFISATIFIALKREISSLRKLLGEHGSETVVRKGKIEAELQSLRARIDDAEGRAGVLVPPTPPKSGFNLSKRSHVLRMYRHGETAESIASALNLPRNEVALLMKMQKIVQTGAQATS